MTWHASTTLEKELIQTHFGSNARVIIARNLPTKLQVDNRSYASHRPNRTFRVVFLSRISRSKNLDFALKVLQQVNQQIEFDVWGTSEDLNYLESCQKHANRLPKNIHVRFCGSAEQSQVVEILGRYDLLFLPTRGENYGHVIAEALTAGTPVLISDRTPWRDLNKHNVGWDLSLDDINPFVTALGEAEAKANQRRRRLAQTYFNFCLQNAA